MYFLQGSNSYASAENRAIIGFLLTHVPNDKADHRSKRRNSSCRNKRKSFPSPGLDRCIRILSWIAMNRAFIFPAAANRENP
jgi:hypothetical protein